MASQQPRKVIHLSTVRMLNRPTRPSGNSGIKITNILSIKPPDADKQEDTKVNQQIRRRSTLATVANVAAPTCALAAQGAADGGTRARCVFTHSGRRCSMHAPKNSTQLCFEHARASLLSRTKSLAPPPPVITTESLLNQLQHYVRPERTRTTSCASSVSVVSDPSEDLAVPVAVDPFKQIDAQTVNAQYSSSIMECASASDSDADSVNLNPLPEDSGDDDTDEQIAEQQPLWRAGVYTAEEAVSEAKNTLKSLQNAYIGQMDRLRILLQNARSQYLNSLKAEREQYCSIFSQARSNPLTVHERRQLRKLKAYAGYHRKHGPEAILARKLHKKRAKINEPQLNRPVPSPARCTFTEYNVRCPNQVLPTTKHCMKHILFDNNQVLFTSCSAMVGSSPCREIVARLPLPSDKCPYHTSPPPYAVFSTHKDDSGSDSSANSTTDTQIEELDTYDTSTTEEKSLILPPYSMP